MWVREWFKMGDAVACYMLNQNDAEEKNWQRRRGRWWLYEQTFWIHEKGWGRYRRRGWIRTDTYSSFILIKVQHTAIDAGRLVVLLVEDAQILFLLPLFSEERKKQRHWIRIRVAALPLRRYESYSKCERISSLGRCKDHTALKTCLKFTVTNKTC